MLNCFFFPPINLVCVDFIIVKLVQPELKKGGVRGFSSTPPTVGTKLHTINSGVILRKSLNFRDSVLMFVFYFQFLICRFFCGFSHVVIILEVRFDFLDVFPSLN